MKISLSSLLIIALAAEGAVASSWFGTKAGEFHDYSSQNPFQNITLVNAKQKITQMEPTDSSFGAPPLPSETCCSAQNSFDRLLIEDYSL